MVVAVRPLATPLKFAPPRNFAAENGDLPAEFGVDCVIGRDGERP